MLNVKIPAHCATLIVVAAVAVVLMSGYMVAVG